MRLLIARAPALGGEAPAQGARLPDRSTINRSGKPLVVDVWPARGRRAKGLTSLRSAIILFCAMPVKVVPAPRPTPLESACLQVSTSARVRSAQCDTSRQKQA